MQIGEHCGKVAAGFVLLLALAGCGSSGGSTVTATRTVAWQSDGRGNVAFSTNDPQYYSSGIWAYLNQSYQTQMSTVTADLEKVSGAPGAGFGIIFCYQDSNNFYRVLIDAYGHYTVATKVAGTYTTLVPWGPPYGARLNSGNGVQNEISVTETSPHNFTVSFNGVQETQFSDANFTGGKAGFYAAVSTSSNENFPGVSEDIRFKMLAPVVYPNQSVASGFLNAADSQGTAEAETGEAQEAAR